MKDETNPLVIIAWGLAIGFILIGLGYALKWVIPAVGIGVGMTVKIISGGLITSALSSWMVPAASAGLAMGGIGTGMFLFIKVVKGAKHNPYEWTLPVLAIVSGLVIDTCKELYSEDGGIRIIYGGTVTCLFLLGGILWRQKKAWFKVLASKIIAVIMFLVPPFLVYLRVSQERSGAFSEKYKNIPPHIMWAIAALFGILLLITFLSWIFKDENDS